ncbi:helix-turn-helix transcriptional regulator [Clostridium beijerinckii]|uniref:helix-turn-helix transcriptional regulator n=1 Tax=Clostridium beijerinckii TaxID=1520 RepID=UPI00047EBD61|nr:helix-turn-helix transcriptional regulator [Clostridium beijerinckii]
MANKTLKAYRMLKGVKQEDIAEILGITLTTYSKKETGKTQFSLHEAKKISDYLNVPIEQLFFAKQVNLLNTTQS